MSVWSLVRPRAVAVVGAALAVLTPFLAAPSAGGPSSDLTWGRTTPLAAKPVGAALVTDRHGTVTVAWGTTDGHVLARRHPAGGAWQRPVVIGHGSYPELGVDRRGTVTAAWLTQRPDHLDGVSSARRPATGSWSHPVRIAPDVTAPGVPAYTRGAADLALAVSPRGAVVAAWGWLGPGPGARSQVQTAYRRPGGPWSAPQAHTAADGSGSPLVGIDARGIVVLAWGRQVVGHPVRMLARQGAPGAGWTRPVLVARTLLVPQLAVDRAGDAVLELGHKAVVKPAGRRWGDVQRLSERGVGTEGSALAMGGRRTATVALSRSRGGVDVLRWTPRRGWSERVRAVRSGSGAFVSLSADRAGDTFLAWGTYALRGKLRPAGGTWGPPTLISPDQGADVLEEVWSAMAPGAAVAVLWDQEERPLKVRLSR